jgi:hypothetical protein
VSVTVQLSPELGALAKAIALIGPDGSVDPRWFDAPLERLRTILSNSQQRAALLDLLEELLPSAPPEGVPGTARWHPLLDPAWPGNVYVVVDGDVIGLAAAIGTKGSKPGARASVLLPLVDLSSGTVEVVAGSSRGPLEIEVHAAWDPDAHPSGIGVRATVDLEGRGALRVAFDDLDAARPGARIELDPTRLDADASRALLQLVADALAQLPTSEPRVARLVAHLPGVLGLDATLQPLPIGELLRDPAAIARWFAAIAARPETLEAWFKHLAGLLGAGLPAPEPTVGGLGTAAQPFRAPLVALDGAALELTVGKSTALSGAAELHAGMAVSFPSTLARVEGAATVAAIPLDAAGRTRLLPSAHLAITAPPAGTVVDQAPTVKLGAVTAGVAWDGTRVVPLLELLDVVLNGTPYPRLDLTDANAVGEAASGVVAGALDEALGTTGLGRALRALVGLVPPLHDPTSPHRLAFSALVQNPTRAIAEVHRAALADSSHPWSHLLEELATLLQAPGLADGEGTAASPWRVPLAALGPARLEIAAWNARTSDTPPGTELLRLGLRVAVDAAPWSGAWTAELLALDLRANAPATAAFLGGQHVSVTVAPGALPATATSLNITVQAVSARASWIPGGASGWGLEATQLAVTGSGGRVGPVTLRLASDTFDASAPDLGLGAPVETLISLVRLLLSQALRDVGGDAAFTLGALVGLHRALRGLPEDWPLLEPPVPGDLGSVLADPLGALRVQLSRVLGGCSSSGVPFAAAALPWAARVLARELPEGVTAATAGLTPGGLGTHEAPWEVPLFDPSVQLLCWLEPEGPPKEWQVGAAGRVRDAVGAGAFVGLLEAVAPLVPEIDAALRGRGTGGGARRLEALSRWLAVGDGLFSTASQFPPSATWTAGKTVPGPHHEQPSCPEAIAQIRAQLDTWTSGAPRAVLLVAAPFADHRAWDTLLAQLEPARPAGAHLDFRVAGADPLALPLDHVEIVATHYTADLADGPLEIISAQLGRAVERIRALTGVSQVVVVAHSVSGAAARAYAAAHPEGILGVITLGTPHVSSPVAPLFDANLAEAVRFAEALQPASGRTPLGRAIGHLAEVLDGAPGYLVPRIPRGLVDAVPGLAIPGALDGELLADLGATAIDRISERAATQAPTQVALGARLCVDLPGAAAGDLGLTARIRVDALRAALPGAAAGQGRLDRAVDVRFELRREDGWLVGGPGRDATARLRWAELGATVTASEHGGVSVAPVFRLHEVGTPTRPCLEAADVVARADALPVMVPLSAAFPVDGTVDRLVVDLLRAAGIVEEDGTGRTSLAVHALAAALQAPAEHLGPRVPAILDVIAAVTGAQAVADGWALQLGETPVAIGVERGSLSIFLRTQDAASDTDVLALAPGLSVGLDVSASLATLTGRAEARLRLGDATVAWSSDTRALTLSDGFSAAPLSLVPPPREDVLRAELARRLPPLIAAALASAVLEAATEGSVRLKGMTRLFAAPADWVLSPDGVGAPGGGLDAARITALLETIGRWIGDETPGKLTLPGAITVEATGADPVRVALVGAVPLGDGGDSLGLQLGLAIDRALAASPSGMATLTVTLPGGWGRVGLSLGLDAGELVASVAPSGAPPIQLLPRFTGFGALASGAALLLPRVLQAAVDALAPEPQAATGLLRATLSVARALGVYDFDAEGFEAPARSAELARMLQPGWLQSKAVSGPAVVGLIRDLLGGDAPVVRVPGDLTASGSTLTWSLPVDVLGAAGIGELAADGGTLESAVTASLGWVGAGGEPSMLLGVTGLRLGPVVADELAAGYEEGLACRVALHLEPGGELAFLQPAVELDVAGDRVAFAVHPLGTAAHDTFAIQVAPTPAVLIHPDAALALLEQWGLPLAARILVRELGGELGKEIWPGGPTVRHVLEQAGVVVEGSSPAAVAATLPPAAELALRALAALVTNVTIELVPKELALHLVAENGRRGLRLQGHQALSTGDVLVDLRFGKADWLDDPAAGVTLWLLEDASGMPPVRVTPALDLSGLGVVVSGADAPLLQGAFELGGAGAFLFLELAFLDSARNLGLSVSGFGAGAELDDAKINVSSDDGDSFLQKILPKELGAPFDIAVAWREGKGLAFYGGSPGGGLELTFPLDLDLVLLRIEELFLALRAKEGAASVEAALTGSASLGPIFAMVQRVGVKASFASGGTKLGFRAPDGFALSIDAGPVSGGGFLFIDEPKGQYAGALQLELQTISITAIGLLNTKLPDGQPIPGLGFSLLVVIAVELPPIQLGFGFTLNGIGGLLGLNRTMDLPALRAGVRNRALDAIMFPPDPIKNATAVVRNLSTAFPVAVDRFVIGPMVRLGWGTPPILTLDVGIILELAIPLEVVALAILGRIKVALPQDDEAAVVLIHLDVLGTIDFEQGEVSIDAVLYDSVIAAFTLTGAMALRARWKGTPSFTLAIGGFHPAFQPPPGFPTLERFAISLATGDNPRVRLEAYLAVTSNTIQFGSALDLHAEAYGFAIDGGFAFDALIQLDPFGLMVDLSGWFSVTWDGDVICAITASVHLTGPAPWHVWGKAHVQVLCFSADVAFDARIGEAALPPPLPPVRVCDLVLASLAEAANWSAQPPQGEGAVSLRSLSGADRVLAHPLGGLTFRQRVAPLELTLERYGTAAVDGPARLALGEIRCGEEVVPDTAREAVRDPFAAGQFLALSDDEKLSRPSFEEFTSGVTLRFDGWELDGLGASEAAPLGYEVVVVDEHEDGSAASRLTFPTHAAIELAQAGPAAAALSRRTGLRRFSAPAAQVRVGPARFAVVGDRAGREPLATAGSYTQAVQAARRLARPGEQLTVVRHVSEEP